MSWVLCSAVGILARQLLSLRVILAVLRAVNDVLAFVGRNVQASFKYCVVELFVLRIEPGGDEAVRLKRWNKVSR